MPQGYDSWNGISNMFQVPGNDAVDSGQDAQAGAASQVGAAPGFVVPQPLYGDQAGVAAQPEAQLHAPLPLQPPVQPLPQPQPQFQPQAQTQAQPQFQTQVQHQTQAQPQFQPQASAQPPLQGQYVAQPVAQPQVQAQASSPVGAESSSVPSSSFVPASASGASSGPRSRNANSRKASGEASQASPQVAYVATAPKKSHGWIVAIVVTVCLCAFAAFCVKSCTDLFGGGIAASAGALDGDAVAVIDLDGTIQYDGSACSPEGFKELLDEASDNEHVKALVLRVNSGGGTATAGEEMAAYLRDFDKPVVVSSASINASAAYEISSQADYIYVAKSTEIGAIGTAMEVSDVSGLLDMLGVDVDVITSADSKDSSYGFRPLTDEEREYYQRMVDQINETFIENVAEGRNMPVERVRDLATGLSFTGVDAVENGLADQIGTREDAVDAAAKLAGLHDYSTVEISFNEYDLPGLYELFGSSQQGEWKPTGPMAVA